MTNVFLQVNKNLFGSGLSPIEMLVLSQIEEFDRNTGDCFISNATMAKNFNVSEKTIARTLDSLEDRGLIIRNTKNCQKGKERHITLAKDKMTLADETKESAKDKMTLAEQTKCPLRKGQNDTIKDNTNKIREKDNIGFDEESLASLGLSSSKLSTAPGVKKPKVMEQALTKSEQVEKFKREMGF